MQGKLNCGHSLYMDNYYNSLPLAAKLQSKQTYCTGTLRVDRKYLPDDVRNARLRKGEAVAKYGEGIMVASWKDKRKVLYLSTEHENEPVTVSNKRNEERQKPLTIVKYNGFMKGIDRSDQIQAHYPLERKTLRWYKKMFIHVLQMCLVNAHYLSNDTYILEKKRKMVLFEFQESIKDALLPDLPNPPRPLARPTGHTVTKIARLKPNSNRTAQNKCCMCKKSTQYES